MILQSTGTTALLINPKRVHALADEALNITFTCSVDRSMYSDSLLLKVLLYQLDGAAGGTTSRGLVGELVQEDGNNTSFVNTFALMLDIPANVTFVCEALQVADDEIVDTSKTAVLQVATPIVFDNAFEAISYAGAYIWRSKLSMVTLNSAYGTCSQSGVCHVHACVLCT
jgi:hypothetical protein